VPNGGMEHKNLAALQQLCYAKNANNIKKDITLISTIFSRGTPLFDQ
jgi:hypothetical protein